MKTETPSLMKAFGELLYVRPLILVIPMTLAGMLAAGPLRPWRVLLTVALMSLLDAAANIINHYSDWDIDKMNEKRGAMHARFSKGSLIGIYLAALAAVTGLLFALSANLLLIATAVVGTLLGALYSVGPKLKDRTPWNYASLAMAYGGVAFCVGLFSQAGSFGGGLERGLELLVGWLPVVLAVVLFDFGYSITKDYVDYEGDRRFGKKTLPVLLGKKRALTVQAGVICAAYLLLLVSLLFGWVRPAYSLFFLSFAVALYMLYKTGTSDRKGELRKAFYIAGYNGMFVRILLIGVVLLGAGAPSPAMT